MIETVGDLIRALEQVDRNSKVVLGLPDNKHLGVSQVTYYDKKQNIHQTGNVTVIQSFSATDLSLSLIKPEFQPSGVK